MSCLVAGFSPGNQHVAEQDGEGLVANQIARDQNGVAEAEWLLLARVADLHHVCDVSHQLGLLLLAVLFEKIFEEGRCVEVIFDGTFAAAGDDNDVLDAGGHALFRDILDLRLINDGQHFLGLRFGGGEESSAQPAPAKLLF